MPDQMNVGLGKNMILSINLTFWFKTVSFTRKFFFFSLTLTVAAPSGLPVTGTGLELVRFSRVRPGTNHGSLQSLFKGYCSERQQHH